VRFINSSTFLGKISGSHCDEYEDGSFWDVTPVVW
jgi:hypothetical protein